MKTQHFSLEYGFYLLAICLAFSLRLWDLGGMPLSDVEANQALQAMYVVDSGEPEGYLSTEVPHTAYQVLTAFAFTLFGAGNAIARIWPAMIGSLLILVPISFKPLLGRVPSLLLAFLLALDPGLVAVSRQAGGEMLALGFTLMAMGMAYSRRIGWMSFFFGLALLSGESVLAGLAGIMLAWVLSGVKGFGFNGTSGDNPNGERARFFLRKEWTRRLIIISGGTILLVGTLYWTFPQGLSNWAASIPAYLSGWIEPTGVPATRLLAALVLYQPLGFIFGLIGTVRGWMQSDPLKKGLSWWFVLALVLSVLYPARQVGDLIWTLVPLLSLAALELAPYFERKYDEGLTTLGLAGLVFLLLSLFWLNLLGLKSLQMGNQEVILRLGVMIGILVLGVITTILIGVGWSWEQAIRGVVWGTCSALGIFLIANTFGVIRSYESGRIELWSAFPVGGYEELLHDTIGDLSIWQTGRADSIDILSRVDAPSLRWALRNYPRAEFSEGLQVGSSQGTPSIVITDLGQAEPSLAATYRGQDFLWWQYPDWSGALPANAISWLTFRRAPIRQEQIILWARTDLFPANPNEASTNATTPLEIDSTESDLP